MNLRTVADVPLLGLRKGQKVSLFSNGTRTELRRMDSIGFCIQLHRPAFTWDMDDEETQVTISAYVQLHGAHNYELVNLSLH